MNSRSMSNNKEKVIYLSKFSTLSKGLRLVVSIQTNCTYHVICTQVRNCCFPIYIFSSLSHADSSFMWACDVSPLNLWTVPCIRNFGMPGIRPDARHVLKARHLSQTLANTEVADRLTSTSTQDCWSWCRTLHSHVHAWHQTVQHVRIRRTNKYYLLKSPPRTSFV